jgi:hypothetical protein
MSHPQTESQTVVPSWSQTLTRILAWQLNLLETHYRVGFNVVEASLDLFTGTKQPAAPPNEPEAQAREPYKPEAQARDDVQTLQAKALEQVQKGVAPPKEIYRVPYRNQIDWSKFPAWAQPIDPEIFEGAGHEG